MKYSTLVFDVDNSSTLGTSLDYGVSGSVWGGMVQGTSATVVAIPGGVQISAASLASLSVGVWRGFGRTLARADDQGSGGAPQRGEALVIVAGTRVLREVGASGNKAYALALSTHSGTSMAVENLEVMFNMFGWR